MTCCPAPTSIDARLARLVAGAIHLVNAIPWIAFYWSAADGPTWTGLRLTADFTLALISVILNPRADSTNSRTAARIAADLLLPLVYTAALAAITPPGLIWAQRFGALAYLFMVGYDLAPMLAARWRRRLRRHQVLLHKPDAGPSSGPSAAR